MRTCPVCRGARFLAQSAMEAQGMATRVLFRIVAKFLTILCLLCPLNALAEGFVLRIPDGFRPPCSIVVQKAIHLVTGKTVKMPCDKLVDRINIALAAVQNAGSTHGTTVAVASAPPPTVLAMAAPSVN